MGDVQVAEHRISGTYEGLRGVKFVKFVKADENEEQGMEIPRLIEGRVADRARLFVFINFQEPEHVDDQGHTSGCADFCGRKRNPKSSPEPRSSFLHAPIPSKGF
jgi:hypothetical protein